MCTNHMDLKILMKFGETSHLPVAIVFLYTQLNSSLYARAMGSTVRKYMYKVKRAIKTILISVRYLGQNH